MWASDTGSWWMSLIQGSHTAPSPMWASNTGSWWMSLIWGSHTAPSHVGLWYRLLMNVSYTGLSYSPPPPCGPLIQAPDECLLYGALIQPPPMWASDTGSWWMSLIQGSHTAPSHVGLWYRLLMNVSYMGLSYSPLPCGPLIQAPDECLLYRALIQPPSHVGLWYRLLMNVSYTGLSYSHLPHVGLWYRLLMNVSYTGLSYSPPPPCGPLIQAPDECLLYRALIQPPPMWASDTGSWWMSLIQGSHTTPSHVGLWYRLLMNVSYTGLSYNPLPCGPLIQAPDECLLYRALIQPPSHVGLWYRLLMNVSYTGLSYSHLPCGPLIQAPDECILYRALIQPPSPMWASDTGSWWMSLIQGSHTTPSHVGLWYRLLMNVSYIGLSYSLPPPCGPLIQAPDECLLYRALI